MSRPVAIVVAVVVAFGPAVGRARPSLDPQSALSEGRLAYERGDYAEAITTLNPLVYPTIELGTEDAVVETHRLLALSYYFMRREPEAEQEVATLLALRPSYELDPVVDPPAAVKFFREIRGRQEERLREIRQRQLEESERRRREDEKKAEEARAKAERVYIERTVSRHNRLIALLPFGAGQFQNGQMRMGTVFAVGEIALGAWWAAMTLAIDQTYPHHTFPARDQDTVNTLLALQITAGAAFWAMVAWGIIDAQVRFVPEVVKTRELPSAPTKKSPEKKVGLAPIVSPSFFGLGVNGAF